MSRLPWVVLGGVLGVVLGACAVVLAVARTSDAEDALRRSQLARRLRWP